MANLVIVFVWHTRLQATMGQMDHGLLVVTIPGGVLLCGRNDQVYEKEKSKER